MAFSLQDAILETSTAPGTGNASLNSATASFFAFGDKFNNGDTFIYVIENTSQREIGEGTYVSASNSIQRDTVRESTNGGAKVDFSGTCNVFVAADSQSLLIKDLSGEVTGPIHMTTSDVSGGSAASTADDLVLEVDASGGLTILTPAANVGTVAFADPDSTTAGALAYDHSADRMDTTVGTNVRTRLYSDGQFVINDTESTDIDGAGLTINQGTVINGKPCLVLKDGGVAHGVTGLAETDTFGAIRMDTSGVGVLAIQGFGEAGRAVALIGSAASASIDTTKSANANGVNEYIARGTAGTTVDDLPADGNAHVFFAQRAGGSRSVVIFDEDGDIHVDGAASLTIFDDHDDVALLSGLRGAMMPPGMAAKLGLAQFIGAARPVLEDAGIVHYNDDGHHFLSMKGLHFLQIDAIRQLAERGADLVRRIEQLETA